jgi:hypothetical protein
MSFCDRGEGDFSHRTGMGRVGGSGTRLVFQYDVVLARVGYQTTAPPPIKGNIPFALADRAGLV